MTSNITLYAKWIQSSLSLHIVTFNPNKVTIGGSTGQIIQTVRNGEKLQKPANPTIIGSTFVGWYTSAALTTLYNFNLPVTSSFTLYAKYKIAGIGASSLQAETDTVTFADAGASPEDSTSEIYTYDAFNRLNYANDGTTDSLYSYKPDGLRLSKTVNGVKTTHIWDGSNIVMELNASNAVIDVYIRGMNLIKNNSGYYIFNAHGDVVALTNASGAVTKNYHYDAFGNETNKDSNDKNPFRYCGEYTDLETNTIYLRARNYNPTTGRFLSEDTHWNPQNMIYGDNPIKWNERKADPNDPLGLNTYTYVPDITAIMQSGNLYAYCINNPLMYTDPNGEALINVICAAIGGLVGWAFGDYIATNLGLSGWKYWAVRGGITVGGAVIGWFAGTAITNVTAAFLQSNPGVALSLAGKLGAPMFTAAMKFLGIDPFSLITDSGKFHGLLQYGFNNPTVQIGLDWAKTLIQKAQEFGMSIRLDPPHLTPGNPWDIWHLNVGKYHVAIDPNIIEAIKKLLGME